MTTPIPITISGPSKAKVSRSSQPGNDNAADDGKDGDDQAFVHAQAPPVIVVLADHVLQIGRAVGRTAGLAVDLRARRGRLAAGQRFEIAVVVSKVRSS